MAALAAAAPRHKTGSTAMRGPGWLPWRVDLAHHWPRSTLRPTERQSQGFERRGKARRFKAGSLRSFLDDGQTSLHDTVQLGRVRPCEILPDAAILAQVPKRSATEIATAVRSDALDS